MAKPKKGRVVSVDMEGVESGGRAVADGQYVASIKSVEEKESKSNGEPMLLLKWDVKGAIVFDNISLQPQALWRLKGLLEALGQEVPDSAMDIDLDDIEGEECGVEITNETYEGKPRPKVTGYLTVEDVKGDKPAKKGKPGKNDDEDTPKDKKLHRKPQAEEETEAEEEEVEFEEGDKVKFKDEKGKIMKGVVMEVDGDTITVETPDEEQWEIEASELTKL